jgi:type II secretory pathway predicted ATPase ExeA
MLRYGIGAGMLTAAGIGAGYAAWAALDAVGLIHQTSRGYPRAVNNLAPQALVAAIGANKAIVDESSTRTAIAEVTAD